MNIHIIIISIEIMILLAGFAALWFYKQKIFGNKLKNSESYYKYLCSEKWEDLKRSALKRADYKCELCGAYYKAVHHVVYPKRYKDDHIDNLVVVCDKCHSKLHGIREEKEIALYSFIYSKAIKVGSRTYSFKITHNHNTKRLYIVESGRKGEHQIEISEDSVLIFSKNLKIIFDFIISNRIISKQFEEIISTNEGTYFFDIKITVNEDRYLKITEAKRIDNKISERDHIMIFEDGVKLFDIGFDNALKFMRS